MSEEQANLAGPAAILTLEIANDASAKSSVTQYQRPPAGRYYRPELDVVRFLAFLAVFLHHRLPDSPMPIVQTALKRFAPVLYASASACRLGVCLFFTLSAFLICELLIREREAIGSIEVKQFYFRRILRIWPLYYLCISLGIAVAFLPGGRSADVMEMGWFVIFMGAWFNAIHGMIHNPMNVLWSVSVEEQFYLVAPWILKYLNRRSLFWFCAALIILANGRLYYLGVVRSNDLRIWADSFVQFQCFAAGILLCLALRGGAPKFHAWQRLLLITASWICWFYACYGLHAYFHDSHDNPGSWPLIGGYALAAVGSVLLLVAFLGVNKRRLPNWAIYLGRISFGLYVYHEFAIGLTNLLPISRLASVVSSIHLLRLILILALEIGLPFALTVLMAAISYRYLETPFLRIKKRHALIESQPIPGSG